MKTLNLHEFSYVENSFKGRYGTIVNNKYTLERDGYKFVIFTLADGELWMADVYKDGKTLGETSGKGTPEEILAEINRYIEEVINK